MSTRESHIAGILIGRKHTGKSTDLMLMAATYPKNKRVLILDVNGSPAYNAVKTVVTADKLHLWKPPYTGVVKMIGTPTDETLDLIAEHFKDGLIIFEDCTKYIPANVPPRLKSFLVDHRMHRCDLIFTFHSWKRVPSFFWEMTSFVVIKKTQDRIDTPRNRDIVPNYEKVAEAANRIAASKNEYDSATVDLMI